MPGKKPLDWSSVDWSEQNRDIAEQFQVRPNTVSAMRSQLRKPQPMQRYQRRNFLARLEQWKKVDWRESNATVGRMMETSSSMAFYMRRRLGKPQSSISVHTRRFEMKQELIDAKLAQLRGLSVCETAKILGMDLYTASRVRRLLDEKGILCDGRRKNLWQFWHRMNLDIGNTMLARIWGIDREKISKKRVKHKCGSAKWNGRIYHFDFSRPEFDAFLRAVKKEQVKVRRLTKARRESAPRVLTKLLIIADPPTANHSSKLRRLRLKKQ